MTRLIFNMAAAVMLLCLTVLPQVDPTSQAANTWQFQYRKAEIGDATHPYENGFVWDTKNDMGVVFGGHLGTYFGQIEDTLVNINNTNMTYLFSFSDFQFAKAYPMDRPPKR